MIAATNWLDNGIWGSAPNSGAAAVAVNGAGEIVERGETVNSDTEPAEYVAVSVEGRARQTDRDAAGLN